MSNIKWTKLNTNLFTSDKGAFVIKNEGEMFVKPFWLKQFKRTVGSFRKLSSAKKVAELLRNG